jgi:hypothetical protein
MAYIGNLAVVLWGVTCATPPPPPADEEETRLLTILAERWDKVNAASLALLNPVRSVLLPEYQKLENDLAMARVEYAKAMAALKEYRKSRSAPR